MNAKSLIPLVAGLGIAGLAAKLGLDFIRKAEGKQAKVVQLWTPTQDIKRGVAIDETMLQPLDYPEKLAPPGALANREKIVGRVPHTGAPAGLPILDSMLLPPGARPGVRVPPGLRAVAVRVDESSGVDNHLEPGCHVDVVGMFTLRGRSQAGTIARTILEDVEVAAVGQRLAPSTPNPGDEGSKKSSKPEPARAVTLLVRPEQVPTLHLAEQRGKIKLCMRGTADGGKSTRDVRVEENDLLGSGKAKPEPQRELTWSEKIAEFVGALGKNGEPQPKPKPAEPPVAEAPSGPAYYWMMVVQNGDERRVLGWQHSGDFQPTEISSSGGGNIFEDPPEYPPTTPPTIGSQDKGSGSQSEPDGVPENEQETESEPEELFE